MSTRTANEVKVVKLKIIEKKLISNFQSSQGN